VHPTHPCDVVGWRGTYLPYRLAVEDVRPLVADRSHVPPSGHTVFVLPGCYLCVFTVRSVEKEGLWIPFFHRNLDYVETIGYHSGEFFSRGGVFGEGMVSVHPVGLPHGPHPPALEAFLDGRRPETFDEVGIMADFATPAEISERALGLSRPDYMQSWSAYAGDPRFRFAETRLRDIRQLAAGLAEARDGLRPIAPDDEDGP
jgi:homogentisate 1,2-dioxygenase